MTTESTTTLIVLGLNRLEKAIQEKSPLDSLNREKAQKAAALFRQAVGELKNPVEAQPLLERITLIERSLIQTPPPAPIEPQQIKPKARWLMAAARAVDVGTEALCTYHYITQYGFINAAAAMVSLNSLGVAIHWMLQFSRPKSPASTLDPVVPSPTGQCSPPLPPQKPEPVTIPPAPEPLNWPDPLAAPIGIDNEGDTCFAAAFLQCLINDSDWAKAIAERESIVRDFFRNYFDCQKKNQTSCDNVALIRFALQAADRNNPKKRDWSSGQHDAEEALNLLMKSFHFDGRDRKHPLSQHMEETRWYRAEEGWEPIQDDPDNRWIQQGAFLRREKSQDIGSWGNLSVSMSVGQENQQLDQLLVSSLEGEGGQLKIKMRLQMGAETEDFISPSVVRKCWTTPPPRITLSLKRWTSLGKKIDDAVNVSEELNVPQRFFSNGAGNQRYRLQSFIVHASGETERGHYLAYVRKGDSFYRCNDSLVSKISPEEFLKAAESGYLFDYRRI